MRITKRITGIATKGRYGLRCIKKEIEYKKVNAAGGKITAYPENA